MALSIVKAAFTTGGVWNVEVGAGGGVADRVGVGRGVLAAIGVGDGPVGVGAAKGVAVPTGVA
ncbi:MAG: hypothetical protein M3Y80_03480, partial [Verrucomicrobiota bacterium]|nr:hypothetical protein [Verrucomicrobiota bacterium]